MNPSLEASAKTSMFLTISEMISDANRSKWRSMGKLPSAPSEMDCDGAIGKIVADWFGSQISLENAVDPSLEASAATSMSQAISKMISGPNRSEWRSMCAPTRKVRE
jgi:hypothetical protein